MEIFLGDLLNIHHAHYFMANLGIPSPSGAPIDPLVLSSYDRITTSANAMASRTNVNTGACTIFRGMDRTMYDDCNKIQRSKLYAIIALVVMIIAGVLLLFSYAFDPSPFLNYPLMLAGMCILIACTGIYMALTKNAVEKGNSLVEKVGNWFA